MRYLPKSPADRAAMLKAIGLRSVDDLFAPIPAEYRLNRDRKLSTSSASVRATTATATPVSWAREPISTTGPSLLIR
jgi:glycine cleavage system pyridoxal-binding protein P